MGTDSYNQVLQSTSQPTIQATMMKTALILLLVAMCSSAYEVNPAKVTFSEAANQRIQAAKDGMVAELCFKEQPEPEIFQTICVPAAFAALGRPITFSANCMTCSNADPICMNTCPQYF